MTNQVTKRNKGLVRSVFRRIMLPALLAGASANIAGMIDGVIVGNVMGSDALAAVNACRPAMQIYGFLTEILAVGLSNCIAGAVGRNDKTGADRTFTAGILTALAAAVIMTLGQSLFVDKVCRLFANDDTLYPLALEYYRVFQFCTFFILACEPMAAAMRTDGFSLLAGAALLMPPVLNAVLDVLFVSVLGKGLYGAALATVLSYGGAFLLCGYYFFFRRSYRLSLKEAGPKLREIISVGTPPSVIIGLVTAKLLVINNLVLFKGGADGMAVMSVLLVAWALESLLIGCVEQTMMPMIAFYYANGDYHGVRAVFSWSFRVLMGMETVLALFLEIFPKVIPVLLGISETKLLESSVQAERIFAIYILMESFLMLAIIYYSATENQRTAVRLSVIQGFAALAVVIFPLVSLFGLKGVWVSFPVSGLIPLGILAVISRGNSERFFRMKGHTYLMEFSIDPSELSDIVQAVIRVVSEAGLEPTIANRTGIAVEEMAVAAFERNNRKKLHVDVTVRKIEDELLVTFSDDGVEFDPLKAAETDPEEHFGNITMLKAVSCKMEYGRVIGMNKTNITLRELAKT